MDHLVPNDFCAYRKIVRDLVPYPCLHSSLLKQKREIWGWLILFLCPSSEVAHWVRAFHHRVVEHAQKGTLDELFCAFEVSEQFPELYQNTKLSPEEQGKLHEWVISEYRLVLEMISYGASSPSPENLQFHGGHWIAEEIHHRSHSPDPRSRFHSNLFFCGSRKGSSVPWVECFSVREVLETLKSSSPALNSRTGEALGTVIEDQLRLRYSTELKLLGRA